MCPWVGPHAPSFGRQLWGLLSLVEYLSPQGVLLPLVYGTTASPLWFELRGHSAWQATPSWTVYRLACHRLLPWLRVTFAMVPDAAWPGSDQWPWSTAPARAPVVRPGRPGVSNPWGVGSFLSLGRPMCARCPGPRGSCSRVCSCGSLCPVCGVLGHLAPVHRCARSVWCVACAVSRAPWLPFTGVPAGFVVLHVRCPGQLGSFSPVRLLRVLLCVRGVLGHLAPVHRCACPVLCFVCAVFLATWLLFTGVPVRFVVLCLRCPGPLGSCSPVCLLCRSFCLCGVLGHLAPVLRCARSVCCFVCAVSSASWLLFTGVPGRGDPPLCCPRCTHVCGVLALVAPVHRCARCLRCACAIGGCVALPPALIFVFFSIGKKEKTGAHVHCRHRHGQLVRQCKSVVSSGPCPLCFGGGRAPGVRLARPDVHGYGSGWVSLGVSLLLVLAG